ncbi:MAG: I78 family peptidase inhibitor [Pseudomonas sp.]|uniref:I78 family peptidase inhibitor n=1 Tax=Pseudomonas abieticivorans TaxID=2931382 RepID=UPI0020BE91F3|nr:I78 family peptidase inhibitor [Pseudomonas sp. PIA16]MDE1166830.1 I78 family peptidase inhibitor [Pseudomonas sp.]
MSCVRASWVTLLAAVVLAGCSTSGSPEKASGTSAAPAPAVANDGRCNADGAQYAIGKPASAALLEDARKRSGAQIARILKPTDVMTLEYRSDRVNLNTDDKGVVDRVNCG